MAPLFSHFTTTFVAISFLLLISPFPLFLLLLCAGYLLFVVKQLVWPDQKGIEKALVVLNAIAQQHNTTTLPLNKQGLIDLSTDLDTFHLPQKWVKGKSGYFKSIFGEPIIAFAFAKYRGGAKIAVVCNQSEQWTIIVTNGEFAFYYNLEFIGRLTDNEAIYEANDKQWGQLLTEDRGRITYLRLREKTWATLRKHDNADVIKPRAITLNQDIPAADRPLFIAVLTCVMLWNQAKF